MKILSITSQHRRDIRGMLVCEGCGHEQKFVGYDDDNYHRNVVPQTKCESCGKSATELGATIAPREPKYPEGMQV